MALGDLIPKDAVPYNFGALEYNVAMGATTINAGEPVQPATAGGLTSSSVIAAVTSTPIVSTTAGYISYVGIAATTSTQTSTANGKVSVVQIIPGMTYLIKPVTAASWDTQAEYDLLVGSRVTIDLTAGTYTVNATNAYINGCVVMPLEVAKYPGRVAIQFRPPSFYQAF